VAVAPEEAVSAYIQGNIIIGPGSAFVVGRNVDQTIYVIGNIDSASFSRIVIPHSNVLTPPGPITGPSGPITS